MTAVLTKPALARVCDNDTDLITVTLAGDVLAIWAYETEADRRLSMKLARAFQDGWLTCNDAQEGV